MCAIQINKKGLKPIDINSMKSKTLEGSLLSLT